ncbi:hypothetical protein [Aeromonas caviae]|uniref:hypothetical protein n=1 Tax=Aeromonas caviae TaxID=648 RepID=UPI0029D6EBF3|nr:hypothetical protein [Aeromonas caviae]MDX7712935.1 hypothetical protein [Aeromonas caviae]MDY7843259.1 hypothetical protein [Aeromonas caviae]
MNTISIHLIPLHVAALWRHEHIQDPILSAFRGHPPSQPRQRERLAVLDAQLTPQGDGWYQLLPVGPFKVRDDRPFDVASSWMGRSLLP